MEEENAIELKIVFLGNSGKFKRVDWNFKGVGKTSIINRYITNNFEKFGSATIGPMYFSKTLVVDGTAFKLRVSFEYYGANHLMF